MVETYFNIIFFKKKDWSDGFKKITFPDKFFYINTISYLNF